MDLIVIVVLLVVFLFIKRNYVSFVYSLGVIELFLRICNFISNNINVAVVNNFIQKYLPANLFVLLDKYASGLLYTILSWALVVCFASLMVYLIKFVIKKK